MNPVILAIDPGASGGLAVLSPAGGVSARKMPETDDELLGYFSELQLVADSRGWRRVAVMEAQAGFSFQRKRLDGTVEQGGTSAGSMFSFGDGYGFIRGALLACNWRLELVRPLKWQKALSVGARGGRTRTEWKNMLKEMAARLYPQLKVTLAVADALLLLEYAKAAHG
jgi:hypothetical protein